MTRYHLERAALADGMAHDVLVEVEGDRIVAVDDGAPADGATRLSGITLPAFVDAHSHAFHRALRFGADGEGDDFWSWRERMYRVAGRLDPTGYEELATAVYAEAALAGIGSIGEFHYLHHDADGRPYDDPNAMAHALVRAAARAGVRLVLIDVLYLRAGTDGPLQGAQIRFGDGSAAAWADRVRRLAADLSSIAHATVAVAAHSVRAVAPGDLRVVAALAHELDVPLHVHLSEQPAENRAALAETGLTPTALLDREGLLGPRTSVVHATHLTEGDVAAIGSAGATVVMCPTTEADLGDGLGAAADLVAAGARLAVGTDAHVTVDLLEETRRIEQHDRLRTHRRGHHSPAALLESATGGGAASLGLPRPAIAVGAPADLVTVATSSPRFGGADDSVTALVRAGTADDVTGLIVAGIPVVVDGRHVAVTDVAGRLAAAIASAVGVTGSGPSRTSGMRELRVP